MYVLGGVYDSPMATDYYVRQYGFLFGGGRSGLLGVRAMQVIRYRYSIYIGTVQLNRKMYKLLVKVDMFSIT